MSKVIILTKNENQKVEIISVFKELSSALSVIDADFNDKHYKGASKYEFGFNIDTINKAFNAIDSFHIVVHPNYPSYHLWRKELE